MSCPGGIWPSCLVRGDRYTFNFYIIVNDKKVDLSLYTYESVITVKTTGAEFLVLDSTNLIYDADDKYLQILLTPTETETFTKGVEYLFYLRLTEIADDTNAKVRLRGSITVVNP